MYRVVFFCHCCCCNTVKSTRRPPVGGHGGRRRSGGEVRWGGALVFSQQGGRFLALLWRLFFVCVCQSPLWPEGTSARLIPGETWYGGSGWAGAWSEGSKVEKKMEENNQVVNSSPSFFFEEEAERGGEESTFTCGPFWNHTHHRNRLTWTGSSHRSYDKINDVKQQGSDVI